MDSDLEGVDRRLSEHHDDIAIKDSSKQRSETSVADIPEEVDLVITPPRSLIRAIESREGYACGQAYSLLWESGPWKDMPVKGYCAEPLCFTTGECTGTRFVPHIDQWTSLEPGVGKRRTMDPNEVIAAVRMFGRKAAEQTGRPEERTDREILAHVKMVWQKTIASIRGRGGEWKR